MKKSTQINAANAYNSCITCNKLTTSGLIYNEGLFHLFFITDGKNIYSTTSSNCLSWSSPKKIFRQNTYFTRFGAGSAIIRGGKLYLAYTKKLFALAKTHLAISKDFIAYNKYPVPIINTTTKLKNYFTYFTPRLMYSEDCFYLLTANATKQADIAILSSQNLMNWNHNFNILTYNPNSSGAYFPSIITLNGSHVLMYSYYDKKLKKEVTVYNTCALMLKQHSYTKTSEECVIPCITAPRTSVLPDGRVILTSCLNARNGLAVLSTPRELSYDNGLIQKPIKELLSARTSAPIVMRGNAQNGIVIEEFNTLELDISILLSQDNKVNISFISDNGASFTATIDAASKLAQLNDSTATLFYPDKADLKILVFANRVELFLDGGRATLAAATAQNFCKKVIIGANGTADYELFYYNLKIN